MKVGQSAAAPERSQRLAESIVNERYRVTAMVSVARDVVVYRAEDIRFRRPIALRVLRDELAADPEFAAAVRDQARTLATFTYAHRGLARVYECDTTRNGDLFVAVERLEGPTLREALDARGRFDPVTALRIASQVGEALEALHHNRIVHGQLDPGSIVMVANPDGTERVMLVGVELTGAYRTPLGLRLREALRPAYSAPEQLERGETTEATDVYALGLLLRELLTGRRAAQTGPPSPTPAVPSAIERIITTALEARPEQRYQDISVMINDIWGAQAMFAESDASGRAGKIRANSYRRARARRRQVAVRMTAAVAAGAVIAAVAWTVLSHRVASPFRSRAAAPVATTVPVERNVSRSVVRPLPVEATPTPPAADAAKDGPAAAPPAAPVVRQERVAAPTGVGRPRVPVESAPDGWNAWYGPDAGGASRSPAEPAARAR
jgi:serine/threonine-protein kinase